MALKIDKYSRTKNSILFEVFTSLSCWGLQVRYSNKLYGVDGAIYDSERLILKELEDENFMVDDFNLRLFVKLDDVKPLLRSMDDMTSEEEKEYQSLLDDVANHTKEVKNLIDWLNQKKLDYRGLINKGWAEEI